MPRTVDRTARRAELVSAASRVFAENGVANTAVSDIVKAAGVAQGTFYLYFESKSAVFDSILDHAMTDLRGRIHRIEVDDPKASTAKTMRR